MSDLTRRHALTATAAGAMAACLPSAASAVQPQMGPNDRRLIELERRWHALGRLKKRERERLGDTRAADDRSDQILNLQDTVLRRMVDTPADTIRGAEARSNVCRIEAKAMFYDFNGTCHADVFERGMIATLQDVGRLAGRA